MDTQIAYEQMREHLLKMPGPAFEESINANGTRNVTCQYRTKDGNACLVGALIDDETVELVGNLPVRFWDSKDLKIFEGVDIKFLQEAQSIHDRSIFNSYANPEEWRESILSSLDKLAASFNLSVKETVDA